MLTPEELRAVNARLREIEERAERRTEEMLDRLIEERKKRKRQRKIVEAEIMSEKGALRITLTNPEILDGKEWCVIEGHSWGIEPDFDEMGEELDDDVLVIRSYYPKAYFRLRDEDISKVEIAAEFWQTMGEIDEAADDL